MILQYFSLWFKALVASLPGVMLVNIRHINTLPFKEYFIKFLHFSWLRKTTS